MPDRSRPRVGYLGPAGTFSEEALLASAQPDAIERAPVQTIYDAVMAVREGDVEFAIVPLENSLEGSVSVTLDLLAGEARDVSVVAEVLLRVSHSLIASEKVALSEIDSVASHPQVLGQCAQFLRSELAHARTAPADSSAEAVRAVTSDGRRGAAAIGTALAASIYGGTVVRAGIEDRRDNETRFAWLARADAGAAPPLRDVAAAAWKTSLVFWGAGADHAGWLVRCLDEFARREINLTKIESRPLRERLGSYMFFADLGGHREDGPVAEAIAGVGQLCEQVHVIGSYRAVATAADGERERSSSAADAEVSTPARARPR
jgi:prephenate dehydratase